MSTIYLVRHGENKANITKEFSHKIVDYFLTAKGVLQAQQTAEYFSEKNIHEIYSSPLKRSVETAEIIASALNLEVVVMEHFREINVGVLEEQAPTPENWAIYDQILNDWSNGKHTSTFPSGEDYLLLLARMQEGIKEILKNGTDRNIIVVGHGGIFTATIKDICRNVDLLEELAHLENHNCSITEIEIDVSDGKLEGVLRAWAEYSHLYGEARALISASPQFE